MSEHRGPGTTRASGYEQPSKWVGRVVFAAFMMILLGCFHAFQGFLALFDDQKYLVTDSGLVVPVDYRTWGWVHLIGGIIVAVVGMSLFAGWMWARIVAVIAAMASAIVNIAFLSAYPIWSAIMITLDILIIWAITLHGAEIKQADVIGPPPR
jgi:hypothetical protein